MIQKHHSKLVVLSATALALSLQAHAQIKPDFPVFIPMDIEQVYLQSKIEDVDGKTLQKYAESGQVPAPNEAPNHAVFLSSISSKAAVEFSLSGSSATYNEKNYFGYFHAYWYVPKEVTLTLKGGTEVKAVAYWGQGCRLQFVYQGKDAGATIGLGSLGLGAEFKQVVESANFKAMGYKTFQPFTLTAGEDGTVNFVEGRKSLIDIFNKYQETPDSQKEFVLLGFVLEKLPNP
jgi:hypothetical protein